MALVNYICRWCGSTFTDFPKDGTCPKCMGPGVYEIPKPVVAKPTYPSDDQPPSASTPSQQTQRSNYPYQPYVYTRPSPFREAQYSLFRTFGFRAIAVVVIIVFTILAVWVGTWLFYTGSPNQLTNPSLQNSFPTTSPTVTPNSIKKPWDGMTFLSSNQAQSLKEESNVVNFAVLNNGDVSYSAGYGVVYSNDSGWIDAGRPIGFSQLTTTGSSVVLTIHGKDYTINIYQAFSLSQDWGNVYIVDASGKLWKKALIASDFVGIDIVLDNVVVTIDPNPNLSLTY